MKKLMRATAILPLLAWSAAAQDPADMDKMKAKMKAELDQQLVKMSMVGAVKGPVVKGMPYSAEEITETNHVLADGTRIHKENKVTVYRDSEGRTRRETPESITVNDPVAGTTYVINPKTNAVQKLLQTGAVSYVRRDSASGGGAAAAGGIGEARSTFDIRVDGDGPAHIVIDGKELDPKQVQEMIAKAKAEGHVQMDRVEVRPMTAGTIVAGGFAGARAPLVLRMPAGKAEELGKKNLEGVIASGTRNTQTIETGEIGNDRPIQIVSEQWYSDEIATTVMSKRTDPRNGDETFRLTNIRRGDPAPYLFQPPAEAHVNERRERKM